MLQIISGKFFKTADRHVHEGKGIFYSNFAWLPRVETCVGTLEPVEYGGEVCSSVFSYVNQIERTGPLVRTGDAEIVDQFRLLAMFGLRCYVSCDRNEVEHLCRRSPGLGPTSSPPASFVPRFFERGLTARTEDVDSFVALVQKVIGLRRDRFLCIVAALRTFCHALQALGYNLNLAYSMLVYCLESLCQHATESPARWEDYDPSVRAELDPLLAHIDATRAEEIQGILLRAAAVRLQRRFIGFAEQHTTDAFFVQEAAGLRPALRRSHYSRALRNAYTMRSRYVHGLEPIQEQLLVPAVAAADYFPWQGEPFLTLAGLLRVTRHVIGTFIQRSEAVESEDVDWRSQLPGTVAFEAAPRYWVWKAENFSPKQAFRRLSGFLSHFDGIRDDDGKSIVDLSNLMEVVERSLPLANAEQRRAMLVMYCLYNTVVIPEGRRENWEQVVDKHSDELGPSIETLVGTVVLGHEPEGPLQEWLSAYRAYQSTRFRKSTVRIPVLMEIEVLSALANKALGEGDHELHKELLTTAIWEAGGYSAVQKYLIGIRDASEPVVRDALRAAEKEDRGARE